MRLAFLDTETTSLRHDRRAWEIGLITRDESGPDNEFSWLIDRADLDLGNADPASLKIGRFYERHNASRSRERTALHRVEELTRGATIIGAVSNFDTEVLAARMRAHGICPSWHHRLICVETYAAGALKMPVPLGLGKMADAFGLTYPEADAHTALGDARLARDLYDAVLKS
jgi:DNA polymerase III epsilon subunit-like protein